MSKDVSFVMDMRGGEAILSQMALATIKEKGQAIQQRAQSMAQSMSSDPPQITMTATVGTIKRGTRAIATIKAVGDDAHSNYIGHVVLSKAKDAGRG